MAEVPTEFASADRDSPENVRTVSQELYADHKVTGLLDSVPLPAILINKNRQVMVLNRKLLDMLGSTDPSTFIGLRPGEIFNCIHARESPGGCGTTKDCQFCGAIDSILESMRTGDKVDREARLITDVNGSNVHFDLLVSSSPLEFNGKDFIIVTMVDITADKRKLALEKVFFHDIGNTIQGLSGSLFMVRSMKDPSMVKDLLDTSERLAGSLMEEISYHKDLLAAENGELEVQMAQMLSMDLLEDAIRHVLNIDSASGKTIKIDKEAERFSFQTDVRLLRRVIVNIVKNALEASDEGDVVKLNSYLEDGIVHFTVWNRSVIPEDVKSQLWQRSFSTKGKDRGLGTYSMKLFVEEYLGGKISFTSEEGAGTTFTVDLSK